MSFKVYSGEFLATHGYPVIIVTSTMTEGDLKTAECHSFFSGNLATYICNTGSYSSEDSSSIVDEDIVNALKQDGEVHIYNHLAKANSIQYQAMLAGYGYRITNSDEKFLLQMHLRNYLSYEIEKKISHNTKNKELKSLLHTFGNIPRITSVNKI